MLSSTKFPGGTGRWGMRRTSFREGGRPHSLVVIADLSVPLREEELKALVAARACARPLSSIILSRRSNRSPAALQLPFSSGAQRAPDWEDDMRSGLEIIETRAEGLSRYMQAYARLAKLPQPKLRAGGGRFAHPPGRGVGNAPRHRRNTPVPP